MISNQILQSTIDGLKSITRKELSVVEKEGKVIATTEENMIGRQIDQFPCGKSVNSGLSVF